MRRASGDHDAERAGAPSTLLKFDGVLPEAATVHTSRPWPVGSSRRNAMLVPSGAHAGYRSDAPMPPVMAVVVRVTVSVTSITGPGLALVSVKAIRRPSGAHDGWSPPNVPGSADALVPSRRPTKTWEPPVGRAYPRY